MGPEELKETIVLFKETLSLIKWAGSAIVVGLCGAIGVLWARIEKKDKFLARTIEEKDKEILRISEARIDDAKKMILEYRDTLDQADKTLRLVVGEEDD